MYVTQVGQERKYKLEGDNGQFKGGRIKGLQIKRVEQLTV